MGVTGGLFCACLCCATGTEVLAMIRKMNFDFQQTELWITTLEQTAGAIGQTSSEPHIGFLMHDATNVTRYDKIKIHKLPNLNIHYFSLQAIKNPIMYIL